jgi:hypothetical protein
MDWPWGVGLKGEERSREVEVERGTNQEERLDPFVVLSWDDKTRRQHQLFGHDKESSP